MADWNFESDLTKHIARLRYPGDSSEGRHLHTTSGRFPDRYSNPRAIRDDQMSSDRSSNFIDTTAQSRFSDIPYDQNEARSSDCLAEDGQLANPSRSSDCMFREGLRDPARSSDTQYIDNGHASLTIFDSISHLDEYSRRSWLPQADEQTTTPRIQSGSSIPKAVSAHRASQRTEGNESNLDLDPHRPFFVQALYDWDADDLGG